MSDKYTIDLMPKLKREDVVLLKKVDRILAKERITPPLDYYNKKKQEKLEEYKIINYEEKVRTKEDLLIKYAHYEPSYNKITRVFIFNKAIPVDLYCLFRKDVINAGIKFSEVAVCDKSHLDYYERHR